MSNKLGHSSHLVSNSPWPAVSAAMTLGICVGAIKLMGSVSVGLLSLSMLGLLMSSSQWWRDVSREASYSGSHSWVVESGMRWGMVLFIASEIMFFASFFWAYFHSSFSPGVELGSSWPPLGVKCFNPFSVPLLNSVILLSSGASVTWSHHAILNNEYSSAFYSLGLTAALGSVFTVVQGVEYMAASFTISDGVFGSSFFMTSGFHGLHVMIGTVLLLSTAFRFSLGQLSDRHCFGFEAAAWYWHFVDVVWLFLFMWVYWWGHLD